ncbi:MAG TPA: carboxypeptidase-like regulatory domain-containing protein, partial [Bacteroidales bacterium]|nr:carboxypeptidase-like regulatory domain-containing protein [Bacteroidales bacterium]
MKITTLMLFVCFFQINANVSSQTLISLKAENATIKQVFAEIEKVSEFRFLYHDGITDLNKLISLNVNEENVTEVLDKVFSKTSSSYRVLENNLVVIIPNATNSVQAIKITGTVTDAVTKEVLPGVNITVEGTTIGVNSDLDGKYTIDVPAANAVLVFSYIGYSTEKVLLSGQSVVDVQLVPDIKNIEEVVVVCYGTQKREV